MLHWARLYMTAALWIGRHLCMNDAAQGSVQIFVSHSHQDNEFGVKLV